MIFNYLKPLNAPVWDNIQVRAVACLRYADSTNLFEPAMFMTPSVPPVQTKLDSPIT
jgi:hypothetical protein